MPSIPNPKYIWQFKLNKWIRFFFGYFLLPEEYKSDIHIVHSVEVARIGPIGTNWAKKLGALSVAQCIGSDINYELKKFSQDVFRSILVQ